MAVGALDHVVRLQCELQRLLPVALRARNTSDELTNSTINNEPAYLLSARLSLRYKTRHALPRRTLAVLSIGSRACHTLPLEATSTAHGAVNSTHLVEIHTTDTQEQHSGQETQLATQPAAKVPLKRLVRHVLGLGRRGEPAEGASGHLRRLLPGDKRSQRCTARQTPLAATDRRSGRAQQGEAAEASHQQHRRR
jgi:hypothetical protein